MIADVTVCIPVYNAEGFVRNSIESVLRQNYSAFKLKIFVDPSDDLSNAICREYVHDERVSVAENPTRLGWVGNVNKCLDHVTTPYFSICFHDDALEPHFLDVLRSALETNPDAVAAFGAMQRTGARQGTLRTESINGTPAFRAASCLKGALPAYGLKNLLRSGPVLNGLRMHEIGDDGFAADWPFALAYSIAGEFVAVPDVLYRKSFGAKSVMAGWRRHDADLRAKNTLCLQAQLLRVVGAAGFELAERQLLVQLILDKISLNFGLSDTDAEDDVCTLADNREVLAPTLLLADLLGTQPSPMVSPAQPRELKRAIGDIEIRMARKFRGLGLYNAALHHARRAWRMQPGAILPHLIISRLLMRHTKEEIASARMAEALYHAKKATQIEQENPIAWMQLARVHARLGGWSDARTCARSALRLGFAPPEEAQSIIDRAERCLEC